MMESVEKTSGEHLDLNSHCLQLFTPGVAGVEERESDGLIFGSFDMHLGLSRLEEMLTLIENVNPKDYSNDWFFSHFSRIMSVDSLDPVSLLTEIILVLKRGASSFRYSEYIECFYSVLVDLQLDVEPYSMKLLFKGGGVLGPDQVWRRLIESAWLRLTSPEFASLKKWRLQRAIDNKESMTSYANYLLGKYRRLLVIRIDFSYKAEYAASITESEARADLSRLFLNRRRNKNLIPDLVGYICRIEWSEKTRYHFHVMLFIDGDKRMKDAYISYKTGLYWENVITKGRGRFYSCNYSSPGYDRCGIGMIHCGNPVEVSNLMDGALSYLVKRDQYLLAHSVGHRKNVWTGQVPR